MKLSEVTRPILENFTKRDYEMRTYPNIITWMTLAIDLTEHFVATGPDETDTCWEWINKPKKRKFYVNHKTQGKGKVTFTLQIKRFAYYLYHLEAHAEVISRMYKEMITTPKRFLHNTCGNHDCFNPEHLIESYTSFDVNKIYDHKRGEDSAVAKLTEGQVRHIYRVYTEEHKTTSELAKGFNVSKATIYCILKGKTWKHLGLKPIELRLYTPKYNPWKER